MRVYLFAAVIMLMAITSMGVFGYLSSGFQDNVLPYEQQKQQIQLLETDKAQAEKLKSERTLREQQINNQIANLPNNYVNGRNRLMAANKEELNQIRKDIQSYTEEIIQDTSKISDLKGQVLQQTAHVGPIIFIADVFGADVNQATKWLIILIICVFDPLAVILTVGANMALVEYRKEKQLNTKKEPIIVPETPSVPVEVPNEAPQPEVVVQTPVSSPPVESLPSEFQKAHELLSKPSLTPHEKSIKDTLEQTIRRYLSVMK